MSEVERVEMLALMERIEAKVDSVLEQLDGLLAVCARLESAAAHSLESVGPEGRTLH